MEYKGLERARYALLQGAPIIVFGKYQVDIFYMKHNKVFTFPLPLDNSEGVEWWNSDGKLNFTVEEMINEAYEFTRFADFEEWFNRAVSDFQNDSIYDLKDYCWEG